MAKTYKTPGIYLEETPKPLSSVARVDTSIPIFIGYTEKTTEGSIPLQTELIDGIPMAQAKRITSQSRLLDQ